MDDNKQNLFTSLYGIKNEIKSVADSALQNVTDTAKQAMKSIGNYENDCQKSSQGMDNGSTTEFFSDRKYCSNCGNALNQGARFCHVCGNAIDEVAHSQSLPMNNSSFSQSKQEYGTNEGIRSEEYVGKIYKCPHCGAAVTQTTALCPECGNKITGQDAVRSVKELSEKLMELEMNRKQGGIMQAFRFTANPTDKQKLALIQSFPIPNSIDDIQEFMLLAIANIDVSLSKRGFGKSLSAGSYYDGDPKVMARRISDAWVGKMQQAYQKAKVLFPNDVAFATIRQLYVDKMTELKIKVED